MVKHILFDLDNTLYPKSLGIFDLVTERIRGYMEKQMGLEKSLAQKLRQDYVQKYGSTMRGLMIHYHLNPEQAGDAFLELGARHLVPMHWGTLQLTDEPLCEPIDRMRLWWQTNIPGNPRKLDVLDVGASLILDGSND